VGEKTAQNKIQNQSKGESMRELTDHIVSGDQKDVQLKIEVTDEPGAGGENHEYRIAVKLKKDDKVRFPLRSRLEDQTIKLEADGSSEHTLERILFQNGPIKETGVNGVTHEALLAIIIDRLRSFQAGPFSCRENAIALTHCEEALMWLQRRTVARIKRGVEGTYQK
jgi:hypothetical protein